MTPHELAEALGGAVFKSGQYYALCPTHADHDPSLAITEEDGKLLLKCRAGCAQEAIFEELTKRGIFKPPNPTKGRKRFGKLIAAYDYRDETGALVYQVVRFAEPKDFRQRRLGPDGEWIWNLAKIEPLPYRLPELLAHPDAPVLIVEGEKDVDNLMVGGFLATCNHGGSAQTTKTWPKIASWLAGRKVVIIPDNDKPGRIHARVTASALAAAGILSIAFLELPGLPDGGDVTDWIEAGGTPEQLLGLLEMATQPYQAAETPDGAQQTNGHLKPPIDDNPWQAAKAICKRYVFVKDVNSFWDRETRHLYKIDPIRETHWSDMPPNKLGMPTDPHDVLVKGQHVGGIPCDKVDRISFVPGEPREIFEEDGGTSLNIWTRPDIQPIEGNATPFLDHILYLVDGERFAYEHLIDYLAHLVQFPAVKIKSTSLLIGKPGIGKSLIFEMLAEILGRKNTTAVETSHLDSQFNEYMDGKQLVVVHELMTIDSRATMNKLKSYITEDWMRINRKNVSTYDYHNRANFLLFSNFEDAARIEKGDRRYFIWISQAEPREKEYYLDLFGWFNNGGSSALLWYLQSRDLSRFDPNAAPPYTAAKERIIEESRSPVVAYLQEAFDAEEQPFNHDLVTINDIIGFYSAQSNRLNYRLTHKMLASFFRSVSGIDLGQKRIHGKKRRVWAIRDAAEWSELDENELAACFREIAVTPLSEVEKATALGRMRVVR